MAKCPGDAGDSTRAVHGGERDHPSTSAVTTPIYQTSTFWFRNSAELRAYQEGRLTREEYGRYGNPTWKAVERKLCELEGAEEAVLFASGMCAATTLFLALLPQGSHLIVTSDCYRRTRQFIRDYLTKLGVETTVIDPADTRQLADAIRDGTEIFFTESPTNPYLRVIDLPEAVRVAHERGVKVVIDSTFASPIGHRPLADGADLVIHSATKYLGGHNDLLAGVVVGPALSAEGVQVYTLAFGEEAREEPGVLLDIASITGGRFIRVMQPTNVLADLASVEFAKPWGLAIRNLTIGRPARAVRVFTDGSFDGFVDLALGENQIEVLATGSNGDWTRVRRTVFYEKPDQETLEDRRRAARMLVELRHRGTETELASRGQRAPVRERTIEIYPEVVPPQP